jgi:hypothetical protein
MFNEQLASRTDNFLNVPRDATILEKLAVKLFYDRAEENKSKMLAELRLPARLLVGEDSSLNQARIQCRSIEN